MPQKCLDKIPKKFINEKDDCCGFGHEQVKFTCVCLPDSSN